jgi:hypothetical protein
MYIPNGQQVLSGALAVTGTFTGMGKNSKLKPYFGLILSLVCVGFVNLG